MYCKRDNYWCHLHSFVITASKEWNVYNIVVCSPWGTLTSSRPYSWPSQGRMNNITTTWSSKDPSKSWQNCLNHPHSSFLAPTLTRSTEIKITVHSPVLGLGVFHSSSSAPAPLIAWRRSSWHWSNSSVEAGGPSWPQPPFHLTLISPQQSPSRRQRKETILSMLRGRSPLERPKSPFWRPGQPYLSRLAGPSLLSTWLSPQLRDANRHPGKSVRNLMTLSV